MSNDTFIREVNEEIRQERARAIWKRYGIVIIALVSLIILGTIGYVVWERMAAGRAAADGDRLIAAQELVSNGDFAGAEAALSALAEDGTAHYPVIARMHLAGAQLQAGDPTAADDLAQDAMMKAWDARASYQMGTNMKAWTFMILRNQFYSEKRRSWRQSQLDQEAAERTLVAVDDPEAPVALDELRQALKTLPEEQREALILVGAGGFAYEEAAEICGCAVGTVKSRVSRARGRLDRQCDGGRVTREHSPGLGETHPASDPLDHGDLEPGFEAAQVLDLTADIKGLAG